LDRQEEIREKGFYFGNIKVGKKQITEAVLNLSAAAQKVNRKLSDKNYILKALADKDIEVLRTISNHYYRLDGIYSRVCNYYSGLYRYDWYCEPRVFATDMAQDKIIAEFHNVLTYLDNSNIKLVSNDIARKAIINSVYYGYVVEGPNRFIV
jgi:hypothetical protein